LLRAVAASMVALYHFCWHEGPEGKLFEDGSWVRSVSFYGVEGVYVFFVISGFIIPYALSRSTYSLSNYPRFIVKRILRLHPPYIAAMALSGVMAMAYELWHWQEFDIDLSRFWYHLVYIIPFTEKTWYNEVYWTLAIEFQYYLVIGLLYLVLARNVRWAVAGALAFLCSSLLVDDVRVVFHYTPVFTAGIAVFFWKAKKWPAWLAFMIIAGSAIMARYEISPATGITTFATAMVIAAWHWYSRLTDVLGEVSYSLYLTHGFAGGQFIYFLAQYTQGTTERLTLVSLALVVSFLFAWLFWKWIEVPSMQAAGWVKYRK
jgi:peptidoglycan/LPS O-acetylase OafA/YrhL